MHRDVFRYSLMQRGHYARVFQMHRDLFRYTDMGSWREKVDGLATGRQTEENVPKNIWWSKDVDSTSFGFGRYLSNNWNWKCLHISSCNFHDNCFKNLINCVKGVVWFWLLGWSSAQWFSLAPVRPAAIQCVEALWWKWATTGLASIQPMQYVTTDASRCFWPSACRECDASGNASGIVLGGSSLMNAVANDYRRVMQLHSLDWMH